MQPQGTLRNTYHPCGGFSILLIVRPVTLELSNSAFSHTACASEELFPWHRSTGKLAIDFLFAKAYKTIMEDSVNLGITIYS